MEKNMGGHIKLGIREIDCDMWIRLKWLRFMSNGGIWCYMH